MLIIIYTFICLYSKIGDANNILDEDVKDNGDSFEFFSILVLLYQPKCLKFEFKYCILHNIYVPKIIVSLMSLMRKALNCVQQKNNSLNFKRFDVVERHVLCSCCIHNIYH